MYKYVYIALTCLLFAGNMRNAKNPGEQKHVQNVSDTSIAIFKTDPAYRVQISYNNEQHTSTLTLTNRGNTVFSDRLSSMFFIVKLSDMNNDGVKDLLIINASSARSNECFYLYLVKERERKLLHVNGFEKILNPVLNKKYNIIEGSALWGQSETRTFYRINNQNKLLNLGYTYNHKLDDDDGQYAKSIKKILERLGA